MEFDMQMLKKITKKINSEIEIIKFCGNNHATKIKIMNKSIIKFREI